MRKQITTVLRVLTFNNFYKFRLFADYSGDGLEIYVLANCPCTHSTLAFDVGMTPREIVQKISIHRIRWGYSGLVDGIGIGDD